MQITCLDLNYQEVDLLGFTFSGITFSLKKVNNGELYEIGTDVKYLKIAYSTSEELSLLHLFLVQHRQEKLGLRKCKIIIIDNYYDPAIGYTNIIDEYWLNIATLSVQIGFKVLSLDLLSSELVEIGELENYKQTINNTENSIIVISKFQNFDICEIDSYFGNFDNPGNTFANLKLPFGVTEEKSNNTFLILLQYISLRIHKFADYSHFLPMALAYNAFCIHEIIEEQLNLYKQKIKGDFQFKQTASVKFLNSQLSEFQQVYLQPESYQNLESQINNYFKLPLHLLDSFTFNEQNKFIFQQMCDVSYFFKAEFFCIYQQFNNLKNAVISQSSRSGKSVTILSVYYFNILTKQKIPVYINLAYNADSEQDQPQPMYNHTSINAVEQIKLISYYHDDNVTYQSMFQQAVNQSYIYQQSYSEVYFMIKQYFSYFNVQNNFTLLLDIFSDIKNTEQFLNFREKFTELISKIFIRQKKDLEQDNNKAKENNEQQQELQENENCAIIILVDEVLQQQKQYFSQIYMKVKELTQFFSEKFLEKISKFSSLFTNYEGEEQLKTIQNYTKLITYVFALPLDDDQKINIQNIQEKIQQIIKEDEQERYIYSFLYHVCFKNRVSLDYFVKFICVTSPSFLSLKQSRFSCNQFYNYFDDFYIILNKSVFDQCLFKFILQLYNPRAIETIFWRNIHYELAKTQDMALSLKKYFSAEFSNYIVQNNVKVFITFFELQIDQNELELQYENPQSFNHKCVNLLQIGTDLALINFVSQNELLYTSASSRSEYLYIQSHIFGGVQLHSSLLDKDYYQNSTISKAERGQLNQQINNRLKKQDILQFYQLIVPELASDLQFVCPLISPQIIVADNSMENDNLVTNSVSSYYYHVNQVTYNLNVIQTHTQILNSLQIIRENGKISLLSQLDQSGNQKIYAQDLVTKEFGLNLFISTSMQLNQDLVFYFFYKASQNFKLYINNQKNENTIENQAQITRLSLKYSTTSEITAIIFFILYITQIDIPYFKNYLKSYQMKNLYLELVQITRNLDKTVQKSEYIPPEQVLTNLQFYFKNAEFMFLQPCLDFIASIWDTDKENRMDRLMKYLYRVLATCYQSLICAQCIKAIEPFMIAVPIDKNHLYNKFKLNSSVADFLVAFFPGNLEAIDYLNQSQFFKQHIENINNEEITFYTCIVESGCHIKEALAEKAEINHNCVFQVTPYIGHQQLWEKQLIQQTIDHTKLYVESCQMDQKDGQNLQKVEFDKALKEKKILQLTLHQERVGNGYTPIYIRYDVDQFNQTVTNLFIQLKMQINYDDNWEERCIYIKDIDIKTCLDKFQPLIHSQLMLHYRKNIQFDIYQLSINKTHLIQQWAYNQALISDNLNQNIQNLLVSYQHADIDISQYQIQESCFQGDVITFLILLQNNFNYGGTIKIVNHIFEAQLPIARPNINQIAYFLNQNNLIILGFEKLKIGDKDVYGMNAYMIKDPSQIQEVNQTYISSIVADVYDNSVSTIKKWFNKFKNQSLLIDNYLQKAKSIQFNEDIINAVNLNLFMQNLSIHKQIDTFFESAMHTDTPIRIKFYNLKTQQFEKQKEKETEIIIQQQDFSLNRVLENLGSRVILASQWIKENNIVILKIVYLFMCQYCQNIDTKCMTTCLECGELLCQEHLLRHCKYFKHFQYRLPNGTVHNLPDIQEEQLPEQVKETSDTKLQKIQFWLSNYDKDPLADPEKTHITNYIKTFKSIELNQQIAKSANIKLFDPEMTVEDQFDVIFGQAKKENNLVLFKYFNLKVKKIEKEKGKGNEIKIIIQKTDFSVDYVLQLLGRRVILASQYKDNIVILRVIKSIICQYCEITDNQRLFVCQDCGEYLCREHVQKHCNEFEHFQYKCHNDSVFNLPKTTSMVEQPAPNIQPTKLSHLETIKQWIASYPPKRSPEVENYLKLFVNLKEENVKKANQKLFTEKNTVEEQIHEAIEKAKEKSQGGEIIINFSHKTSRQFITQMNYKDSEEEIFQKFTNYVLVDFKAEKDDDITILDLFVVKPE